MTGDLVVTFVCTANICRSAYATVRARQLLGDGSGVRVGSAGTYGGRTGEPLDEEIARQARARGADADGFRARRVDRELITGSDLVLAAETSHQAFLLEEWPAAFKKVFTFAQFADAIAGADPALTGPELLAHAQRHRRAADPAGNIADPYRRGPEAAAACADQIDGLLAAILPRLSAR